MSTIATPSPIHGISAERHNRIVIKAMTEVVEAAHEIFEQWGPIDLMQVVEDRVYERELLISQKRG